VRLGGRWVHRPEIVTIDDADFEVGPKFSLTNSNSPLTFSC
jgi:hypothetical protein